MQGLYGCFWGAVMRAKGFISFPMLMKSHGLSERPIILSKAHASPTRSVN